MEKSQKIVSFGMLLLKRFLLWVGLALFVMLMTVFFLEGLMHLNIDCSRPSAELFPSCEIRETRLLGLYNRYAKADKVSGIVQRFANEYSTDNVMALVSENGEIPVNAVSSNYGTWKAEVKQQVEAFLGDQNQPSLKIDRSISSISGWFGAGGLIFFAAGLPIYFLKKLFLKKDLKEN